MNIKLNKKEKVDTKSNSNGKDKSKDTEKKSSSKLLIVVAIIAVLVVGAFYGLKYFSSKKTPSVQMITDISTDAPQILTTAIDYKDHWAKTYLIEMVQRGILLETSSNTLSPDGKAIRAQYIVALYKLDNGKTPIQKDKIIYFEDVIDNFFYTDAINWGSSNGFMTGTSSTKFEPNQQVSKEQAVTVLYNYYKTQYEDNNDYSKIVLPFEDSVLISKYASDAMKWAYINGLLAIYSDNQNIEPKIDFTRAEIAALFYCYIKNIQEVKDFDPSLKYNEALAALNTDKK